MKWFEDPLQNGWATEQNAYLRERIAPIQLATGNLEYHYKAFHDIIARRATDIIQPEIQWCGGLTPTRRIAAMARALMTCPSFPTARPFYNYHFVLSNSNSPYAEFLSTGEGRELHPIFDTIIGEPLPINGHVTLDPEQARLRRRVEPGQAQALPDPGMKDASPLRTSVSSVPVGGRPSLIPPSSPTRVPNCSPCNPARSPKPTKWPRISGQTCAD